MNTKPPVFLARAGYRRRRAMDAARLLPVVGLFLFLLPLLWRGGATGQGIVFLFVVWIGLIAVAGLLSRPLNQPRKDRDQSPEKGSANGPL